MQSGENNPTGAKMMGSKGTTISHPGEKKSKLTSMGAYISFRLLSMNIILCIKTWIFSSIWFGWPFLSASPLDKAGIPWYFSFLENCYDIEVITRRQPDIIIPLQMSGNFKCSVAGLPGELKWCHSFLSHLPYIFT